MMAFSDELVDAAASVISARLRMLDQENTSLLARIKELEEALREALEYHNDDNECLAPWSPGGVCPDTRCGAADCMVVRVNQWREALAGRGE